MGLDHKKLQKKKAKKAAKDKARKSLAKKKSSKVMNVAGNMKIKQAVKYPVYQCWVPAGLFEGVSGVGTVVITRKNQQNDIVMAIFLLDVFCLGVKNAYISMMFEKEYKFRLESIEEHEALEQVEPSYARKLIEGAEEYANSLGFSPHKDYHLAKKIFGDIQTEMCSEKFEFGREGKPFYTAGPYDDEKFRKKVVNQLREKCGSGGFNYFMPIDDLL